MSRLNYIWGGISSDIRSEIQFYGDSGLQCVAYQNSMNCRLKSGKFGRPAKFGQRPCLFHILIIGIKNKLTKQTVKILMRRQEPSRLIFHCLQMYVRVYLMSEVTRLYPIINQYVSPRQGRETYCFSPCVRLTLCPFDCA